TSIQRAGADRRELLTREGHAQERGRSSRRPGADREGKQIEARFGSPDDGRSLVVCPFLSAGQRSSTHAVILAASRGVARGMGGGRLQPPARKSRLTQPRC